MSKDNRLHYVLYRPEPESYCLYYSILRLEKINGCEEIVSELTKKLEELFVNVPEHECTKELDNLVYYENGLITKKGEYGGVVASPWISTAVIKEPVKKPKKHLFKYLKYILKPRYYYSNSRTNLGMILYYQMRLHNKSNMTYNKIRINFVDFLKKAEAFLMLSEQERKLTEIRFPLDDMYMIFYQLRKLLGGGYYFSNAQCEDVMLIYDTFPDKDVDMIYSYRSNELTESCDKYLNSNVLYRINKNFNEADDYIKSFKKTDESFYEKIINYSVEVYKELYDVKETNMRTLLIKLGIIEESYMPSFGNLSEEVNT